MFTIARYLPLALSHKNAVHAVPTYFLNLLATDFFFQILAHPVFKM